MAESCSTRRARSSGWRSWRGSAAWRRAWRTKFVIRWARWAPTWRSCAAAGPRRGDRRDAGSHRADRANGAEPADVRKARGEAGASDLNAAVARASGFSVPRGCSGSTSVRAGWPAVRGDGPPAGAGGGEPGDQRMPGLAGGSPRGSIAAPGLRARDRAAPGERGRRRGHRRREFTRGRVRRRCRQAPRECCCSSPMTAQGLPRPTGSGCSIRFTPRRTRERVGLGLALVARTMHEVGGTVWVDRAREGGAAFKVFLPAAGWVESNAHSHR